MQVQLSGGNTIVLNWNCPWGNCPRCELSGGQLLDVAIVRGTLVQGVIIRGAIAQGVIVLEPTLTLFYYVNREAWLGNSKKLHNRKIRILHFLTHVRIQKCLT